MNRIKFEKLNEAVVKTNNSVDTERVYDVESNARIFGENKVASLNSGNETQTAVVPSMRE